MEIQDGREIATGSVDREAGGGLNAKPLCPKCAFSFFSFFFSQIPLSRLLFYTMAIPDDRPSGRFINR